MADKKNSGAPVGAIVAGIAAVSAAAVGAYYLYGHKDAKKHRSTVKGWMLKAKGEVLEELENVKDVSESAYMHAVDAVVRKYQAAKSIDAEELAEFLNDMKGHWNGIKKTVETRLPSEKPAKRASVKKPAARKKASKK
jgi:hypothetical protein